MGRYPACPQGARNQHGKSEQIKAAIREHEILLERRQNLPVFPRNLLHLLEYG